MTNIKILIITPEMFPYTELSEQSMFIRDMALNLQKKGAEIRVFMPKFGPIKERKHRLHEVIRLSGLNITIGRNNNPLIIKVASLQTAKIQIYFLDNDDFFERKSYFHDGQKKFYKDNDERLIFFNKGTMELLIKLGWIPDVMHCQGWMSSLIPIYAKTIYKNEPAIKNVKMVYSVYEDGIKNSLGSDFHKKAHINISSDKDLEFLVKPDVSDLYKAGVNFADAVVFSSPQNNKEVESYVHETKKPTLNLRNNQEEIYGKYLELVSDL
jgi:starch synthase